MRAKKGDGPLPRRRKPNDEPSRSKKRMREGISSISKQKRKKRDEKQKDVTETLEMNGVWGGDSACRYECPKVEHGRENREREGRRGETD